MRLLFTVAYDGPAFAGWQSQKEGGAVQDAIETAVASIAGRPLRIHGAGRTDAGVHALAQRFHLDVPPSRMDPDAWRRALNSRLPPSARILSARQVPEDFHARFSAQGKIYRYRVRHGEVLPPHEHLRAWHVPRPVSLEAAKAAAALFVGRHDFSAFSANRGGPPVNGTRTLRRVDVSKKGRLLSMTFEGDGFLYKMVRMLAGAIARAADGRASLEDLARRLADGGPKWTHTAPPDGLFLVRVLYPTRDAMSASERRSQAASPSKAPSKS